MWLVPQLQMLLDRHSGGHPDPPPASGKTTFARMARGWLGAWLSHFRVDPRLRLSLIHSYFTSLARKTSHLSAAT